MAKFPQKIEDDEDIELEEEEDEDLTDDEAPKKMPTLGRPGRPPKYPLPEAQEDVEEEASVREPSKNVPKKAQKRFAAFFSQARAGIVDTQTSQPLYSVPPDSLWFAEMIADIKSDLDEIKDMLGRI